MLEIHLSGRIFSSATPLSSFLPSTKIKESLHVILSDNQTFPIITSLWKLIFNDKRLRSLSLVDFQLNENDAALLAQYFTESNQLSRLTFDTVRGTMDIFHRIFNEGLINNTSVKRLSLTNVQQFDIRWLAEIILKNERMEYLSLRDNHLTGEDVNLIVDALKINKTLKAIDLSHNFLGNSGALILANVFQHGHSSIHFVNLIDNHIDEEKQKSIVNQCKNSIEMVFSCESESMLDPSETFRQRKFSERKSRILSVIYVTSLFFLWGIPHQLNDVLIRQFTKIFVLNRFTAGLVQSSSFMGYFVLALPAAYVLRRWGYKLGIILGFVLYGTGSFLFWPAALTGQYPPFLLAIFVLATGLAFLETAANPYIANAAGPMETSEKRLNIVQAFNPLGTITGAVMGSYLIFSDIYFNPKEIEQMRQKRIYDDYLKQETLRVVQPYAIIGGMAFLWATLIARVPFPIHTKNNQIEVFQSSYRGNRLYHRVFLFSVIAQFVYVGAQVGTWSYFMQYIHDYVDVEEHTRSYLLIASLVLLAIGRLIAALFMHLGCSPALVLASCALSNVVLILLTVVQPNSIGVAALLFTSLFMGPMFPTIFALGIKNMDESTTKLASCFLVMACIGGAIFPFLMNLISIQTKCLFLAYLLPGAAYMIVAIFALFTYEINLKEIPSYV